MSRRAGAGRGLCAGLLAGAVALGTAVPRLLPAQASTDTASLMRDVRALAADSMEGRRIGTPGAAKARRYLAQRLRELGVTPLDHGFDQSFAAGKVGQGVNLLGTIKGMKQRERYVVLSAHYDHVGIMRGAVYNGADDNASGTAALLALARELKRRPLQHSVILAWFDGEEAGLLGAKAFIARPPVPLSRIALDVNLDMVGHSERGELWAAGGAYSPTLRAFLERLAAQAPVRLLLGHDRPGIAGQQDWTGDSDHAAFHDAGIPFIYFGVEDHKDYHRPTDDPETLTPLFYSAAVRTILQAVRGLDSLLTVSSPAGTLP